MNDRAKNILTFVLSAIGLFSLWEIIAVKELLVPRLILPPPSEIAGSLLFIFANFFRGVSYWTHTWITVQEIVLGFALGSILAFIVGALMEEFETIKRAILPYTVALNTTPKIAFAPLFTVWFGFGSVPKVVMAAFICFFPVFVNTFTGLLAVEREQIELMMSLRASKWQMFRRLKLKHALPYVFAGLKTGMVFAVIGAVIGEFAGAQAGLGYLIEFAASRLRTDEAFAFIALLSLLGYLLYAVIEVLERRIVFWRGDSQTGGGFKGV